MSSPVQARVLSNLPLPAVPGFPIRTFGDYRRGEPDATGWRPEMERRRLSEILPLIPSGEQPDILMISSPEYLPIPIDIATFPGLKILLITDWNVCLRFLPNLCPLFDFCFTDWPGYRLLKRAGITNIHHQPLFGHDPEVFLTTQKAGDRDLGQVRDLDLSFCGNLNSNLHADRNRLVARLAWWSRRDPGRKVSLGQAFGPAYVGILNRSRLVFNYAIRREANMRLFEAMACGAIPLVESSNQEAAILFQENRHYFRYEPGQLEARLDALLADPARLAEVSAAAREAVARHTKAHQVRALLETTCRESALTKPTLPSNLALLSGRKALLKLRVLGMGYTYTDALQEIQIESKDCAGLELETQPALLTSVLMNRAGETLPAVVAKLETYLKDPGLPAVFSAFLKMKLALLRGNWKVTIEQAGLCLESIRSLAAAPDPNLERELLGYFHPPLNLGQGLNADLNRAYYAGLEPTGTLGQGKPPGYRELLAGHCAIDMAAAQVHLGNFSEAAVWWKSVPRSRFASLDPYKALLEESLRIQDYPWAQKLLEEWFALKPLDMSAWDALYQAYRRIGDKAGTIRFLESALVLTEVCINRESGEPLRLRLAQERAEPSGPETR